MGRMSRNKGKSGEREAAREIQRLFRVEAHRGRQYQGGDDSPDIVTGIPGVRFEVKRTEKLQLYAAMQQAIDDAQDHLPVVLHRANTRPWVAIVRLEDLPELVVKLYLVLAAQA